MAAYDVRVWLRDKDGHDLSVTPQPTYKLDVDQVDATRGVPVRPGRALDDLRFTVEWNDGKGHNIVDTKIAP